MMNTNIQLVPSYAAIAVRAECDAIPIPGAGVAAATPRERQIFIRVPGYDWAARWMTGPGRKLPWQLTNFYSLSERVELFSVEDLALGYAIQDRLTLAARFSAIIDLFPGRCLRTWHHETTTYTAIKDDATSVMQVFNQQNPPLHAEYIPLAWHRKATATCFYKVMRKMTEMDDETFGYTPIERTKSYWLWRALTEAAHNALV